MRLIVPLLVCLLPAWNADACNPPAPQPAIGERVSGAVMLQGHAVPLPVGSWLVAAGDSVDGQFIRLTLTRTDSIKLTGVIELTDVGSIMKPGNRSSVVPVCQGADSLLVALVDTPADGPANVYDCVRVDAATGGTQFMASANPAEREFGRRLMSHGVTFPTTEVGVAVASRAPAVNFIAQTWFDPTEAGFPGVSADAWQPDVARNDPRKVAYARRAVAWGLAWRKAIVQARSGGPVVPVPARF